MREIRRISLQLSACLLLPVLLSACALADQYRWTGVPRVVAMSDPHGAYDSMVRTLTNASVGDRYVQYFDCEGRILLIPEGSDASHND